jgi:hypothetical protein
MATIANKATSSTACINTIDLRNFFTLNTFLSAGFKLLYESRFAFRDALILLAGVQLGSNGWVELFLLFTRLT